MSCCEKKINWNMSGKSYSDVSNERVIADLQEQLAKAQAEIEADNRNAQGFLDQIHEMSQEIARMRPVVGAAILLKKDLAIDGDLSRHYNELVVDAVRGYEAGEKP